MVSAGNGHTVLLRSDGTVVACGSNRFGQGDIPPLDEGVSYTQISAGGDHTVLLRSDGSVVACGSTRFGQCDIPPFDGASCRYICDSSCVPQLPIPDCVLQMSFACEGDAVVLTCFEHGWV